MATSPYPIAAQTPYLTVLSLAAATACTTRAPTVTAGWLRALDGYANERKAREAERDANWARIVAADQAAIAKAKFADKNGDRT